MEMSMNEAVSTARLEKLGYSKFFDFTNPMSSYSSWTEKQIIDLQMLVVDSSAQAKIAHYSEECPVVYPQPTASVKLYDCFWYVDVNNEMQCPMLYQVTDIIEKRGIASCRLVILEIPPASEKAAESFDTDNSTCNVLDLSPSVPPPSNNNSSGRSRLYNLGETLHLDLRKIVRCPKLNQRGFQMLGRNGVKIKSEADGFEVDFGAFLGAGESTTFDRDRAGSLEDSFDDDDDDDDESDDDESNDLALTVGTSLAKKVEAVSIDLDESVDSDVEETSKVRSC